MNYLALGLLMDVCLQQPLSETFVLVIKRQSYICGVCVCLCFSLYSCVCMCMEVRGQPQVLFLMVLSALSSQSGSLAGLEFADLSRLAGWQALGIHFSQPFQY